MATDAYERAKMLGDIDLALAHYGMAFSLTSGASPKQKAKWFEEARLALRRVRDALSEEARLAD
jgi:hypothetical protein